MPIPTSMTITDAPGLKWRATKKGYEARWRARPDLVKRGYRPKVQRLWLGQESELSANLKAWVADRCRKNQKEMLIWGQGGLPTVPVAFTGTLKSLIDAYQTDVDSTFHKLRYQTRLNHGSLLRRLTTDYGDIELCQINARLLLAWHKRWSEGGKVSMGHGFVSQIRTLVGFGATMLEDRECERLCGVLHKMRFPMAKPRGERLTAEQATLLRIKAHELGWHSIALAQAIQFECMFRQKDVIGEWVPNSEPGMSDLLSGNEKWITGLRWSEIDQNLILRHTTSKRQKDIEVNLRNAPMVMEELALLDAIPTTGPVIVSEYTELPFTNSEFRRRWRQIANAAGLPKGVKNMDSRAGGISEATDAGASLETVRHAATHSNVSTTANYSRGSSEKIVSVQLARSAHRKKTGKTE